MGELRALAIRGQKSKATNMQSALSLSLFFKSGPDTIVSFMRLRRNKISAIVGSTRANLWPIIRLQETESSVTNEPIVNCKTRCRSECVCRPGRRVFLVVFSRVWPCAFSLPLNLSVLYSAQ